ncbi:Rrf2 family transcriptional regulator [Apibacter muscae]|uniref:Rrf2 family transcriptional regulator n=1 Tax=Apibacter muscae TaxID=2509004 RepID=A0A563DG59_9FLAO|nr:Rrf2 family transcriptional regulator [Apibacter muscae]TWP29049.1 Rrf2 family transcriptional regulator [Apibacter muscae]
MFSKTSEYAIKIMIYLSSKNHKDNYSQVKEISQALETPEPFTAKILQQLAKVGLLISMKGKNGGFALGKDSSEIKILDIVIAIDGSKSVTRCVLGLSDCSNEDPCPLHHKYYKIKEQIKKDVLETNLKDIKDRLKNLKLK